MSGKWTKLYSSLQYRTLPNNKYIIANNIILLIPYNTYEYVYRYVFNEKLNVELS
jgi:hypothetical protein